MIFFGVVSFLIAFSLAVYIREFLIPVYKIKNDFKKVSKEYPGIRISMLNGIMYFSHDNYEKVLKVEFNMKKIVFYEIHDAIYSAYYTAKDLFISYINGDTNTPVNEDIS